MTPPRRAGALLLCATLASLLSPGDASAAPGAGLRPAFSMTAAPSPETTRGWFVLPARPGTVLGQAVQLTNLTDRTQTVELHASDAVSGSSGGVTFPDEQSGPLADGRWVALDTTRVELPPRGTRRVGVTVRIPSDPRSGTHVAGVVARSPLPDARGAAEVSGSAAVLAVHVRQAIAVEVRLPGDAGPDLRPTSLAYEQHASGPVLRLGAANVGNGLTRAHGSITLAGPSPLDLPATLDPVVPRTSLDDTLPLARPLAPGRYAATVALTDSRGRTRTLSTGFDVAADPGEDSRPAPSRAVALLPLGDTSPAPDRAGAAPAPVPAGSGPTTASAATTGSSGVPLGLSALAAAATAAVGLLLALERRRRRA